MLSYLMWLFGQALYNLSCTFSRCPALYHQEALMLNVNCIWSVVDTKLSTIISKCSLYSVSILEGVLVLNVNCIQLMVQSLALENGRCSTTSSKCSTYTFNINIPSTTPSLAVIGCSLGQSWSSIHIIMWPFQAAKKHLKSAFAPYNRVSSKLIQFCHL